MSDFSDGLSDEEYRKHNEGFHPISDNYTYHVIEGVKRDIENGYELVPGLYPKEFYGSHYPLSNSLEKE